LLLSLRQLVLLRQRGGREFLVAFEVRSLQIAYLAEKRDDFGVLFGHRSSVA
jgi:hypothetical protein